MNIFNKTNVSAVFAALVILGSSSAFASDHGMHQEAMHEKGSHGEHMKNMREVMGKGRLNKIMAERGMVNINHEPMPEMNWPKMRMNFQVQEGLDLSELNLGDEVEFTLMVDDDNNYIIKDINAK